MNRTGTIWTIGTLLAVFIGMLLLAGQAEAHTWTPTTIRIVQVKDFGKGADFDTAMEVWINPAPSTAGDLGVTSGLCVPVADRDGCLAKFGEFEKSFSWRTWQVEAEVTDLAVEGALHRITFRHPTWPISQRVEYSIAIGVEADRYVYMTGQEDVADWCVQYDVCVDEFGGDETDVSVNGLDVVVQPEPGVTLTVERYQAGDSAGGPGLTLGVLSMAMGVAVLCAVIGNWIGRDRRRGGKRRV